MSIKFYLSGLIEIKLLKWRRPRKGQNEALLHDYRYSYKVRTKKDGVVMDVTVCYKGFLALHGICARTLQTIQEQLKECGKVVRWKHKNRQHAISDETKNTIDDHIQYQYHQLQ
ncbi:hypothetical protein ANN_13733 [Periplaneta americana]|uniref:Uncharacterized protein n=1 Tax=Periplaneta americana TaxID=6978 RepID=A0ABQ8SVN3_PERAM|nr:hypothetical protein ANN_13733 [Periplaneta americana]